MPPGSTTPTGPFASTAKLDRKSTRLNSSHSQISYAVFCLKKNKCCNILDRVDTCLCFLLSRRRGVGEGLDVWRPGDDPLARRPSVLSGPFDYRHSGGPGVD